MNIKRLLSVIQNLLGSGKTATTYTIKGKLDDITTIASDTDLILTTDAINPVTAGDVLDSHVCFVNGAKVLGSMEDVSADIIPTGAAIVIPAGFHDGTKHVTADTDLVTGNIIAGVTIYGVTGKTEVIDTFEDLAAATAADLVNTKVAFVNGAKITGANANLVDTTDAVDPAAVGDVALGKVFFVNGVKYVGTSI